MRKLSGALLAGVAGVAVGASGLGVAGAATGGSFLLGRSNHETATATLTSDRGAPLALHAVKGQPPLTVNSSTMVRRLNAAEVGGLPAAALQHTLTGRCGTGIAAVTPTGSVSCATAALPILKRRTAARSPTTRCGNGWISMASGSESAARCAESIPPTSSRSGLGMKPPQNCGTRGPRSNMPICRQAQPALRSRSFRRRRPKPAFPRRSSNACAPAIAVWSV